ncbi:MAG: dephospho-CoA kinase [Eubacteriales bacterium]
MIVIGLTGSMGSGKSTVSHKLKELGAVVIDADQVARDVVEPGMPALHEIVQSFGKDILREDGTLDRRKLGALVFAEPAAMARLNAITHPRIEETIVREVDKYRSLPGAEGTVLVIEAPLLLEIGLNRRMDEIWVVKLDEDIEVNRLAERDKISPAEARRRLAAQLPQAEKLKAATRVIDNSGSRANTEKQVIRQWEELLNKHGLIKQ